MPALPLLIHLATVAGLGACAAPKLYHTRDSGQSPAAQSRTHPSAVRQSCPALARSAIYPATLASVYIAGTAGSARHVRRSTGGFTTTTRGLLLAQPVEHSSGARTDSAVIPLADFMV